MYSNKVETLHPINPSVAGRGASLAPPAAVNTSEAAASHAAFSVWVFHTSRNNKVCDTPMSQLVSFYIRSSEQRGGQEWVFLG